MIRIYSLTAPAVLMLWSLAPAHGASKPKDPSPSAEAKMMLQEIDALSGRVSDTAFSLAEMARTPTIFESHLDGLAVLKEDVNKIGKDLQSLDAERDSLAAWEVTALDQTIPLMQEVAHRAGQAIQILNSNQRELRATSYVEDTATISKEAGKVATLLHDYLKLAKTREKESQLEHGLGDASGF